MRLHHLLIALGLLAASTAVAETKFRASDIPVSQQLLFCDLDGDLLQDVVFLETNRLSLFYQDAKQGFSRGPNQEFSLGDKQGVLWAAQVGRQPESVLLATDNGVTEFCFTNRTAPPEERQIIQQQTLISRVLGGGWPPVVCFPLSVKTKNNWPLLLLPTDSGLQVWQHREHWKSAQMLVGAFHTSVWPNIATNAGYARFTELDFSLSDVDGNGCEDLLVRRPEANGMQNFLLFLQKTDGLFAQGPAMTYNEKPSRMSWLCWQDLNRDGKVDLIKSTRSGDAWFLPGAHSGKVLVGAYIADAQGRLPTAPQQVFRKNDAMSTLPVVDIDGDGFADLALGSAPFDSREGVRRMITTKELALTLKFHFYRPDAGYPVEPDCQTEVVFKMDYRSFYVVSTPHEQFEHAVNLSGDFDGDGKKDLLVRDRGDHLSVFPFVSREKGFSDEPKLQFDGGEPIQDFQVKDLNGDGVSDLIVKKRNADGYRVFTSCR